MEKINFVPRAFVVVDNETGEVVSPDIETETAAHEWLVSNRHSLEVAEYVVLPIR